MSFRGMLNQAITIYTRTGYTADGREEFGDGESISARVEVTSKRRLLPDGSLITIEAICYVAPSVVVTTDDKISYNGVDYKVYGVYVARDGSGNAHHAKLELTKWHPV